MRHNIKQGHFVISLDFELFWGMFDKHTLESYGARIKGERTAIPRMLTLFTEYGIHATWATVGMLMARSKVELTSLLPAPKLRPTYRDMHVSAYTYIENATLGDSEADDLYHYGSDLVRQILRTPHQEIGNHTFSHFYCLDGKMNAPEIFDADLTTFDRVAESYGIHATSIVFPRNQSSASALRVATKHSMRTYRGNENHFLYRAREESRQSLLVRGLRLLDHYMNISGHHTYPLPKKALDGLMNIPASRFLRPWSRALRFLEPLRLRRIKNAMTHAAKNGEVFHLWWHPHNFGINQEKNFRNLTQILEHYKMLEASFGMRSASMSDIATIADEQGT